MSSSSTPPSSSTSSSSPSVSERNSAYERHSHTLADPSSDPSDRSTNPVTLTRFLEAEGAQHPSATGRFTMLLQSIQLAVKVIAAATRKAGIGNLYGLAGGDASNSSGEAQKKLDLFANSAMLNCLMYSEQAEVLVSEEEDHPIIIDTGGEGYAIAFDPLDGSSNCDCNLSIGTIFAIYRHKQITGKRPTPPSTASILRPGDELIAAGYACYDTATMLTLTTGKGVNMSHHQPHHSLPFSPASHAAPFHLLSHLSHHSVLSVLSA